MNVAGIIVAAGNSTRFGQDRNKNLFEVNGKPIVLYSIEAFNNSEEISEIILVIKEDEKKSFESIIKDVRLNKPIKYVNGGNSRMASVYNALCNTESDFVVIHDGARPNIKLEFIENSLKEMDKYKGTTVAVKAKDTIKICDENGVVVSKTNRQSTWQIQTPQCFDRQVLKKAHEECSCSGSNITDDCMVLEKCGYDVKIIEGDYSNIKVTTYDDLRLVTI